jgi:hypothetical protein
MKPKVATALSLVAVLGAGALAAAANFRVLAGPEPAASASAVGSAEASPAEPFDRSQTFTAGRAGSLTLDATGGLHLVRVDPSPGWRAAREPSPAGTVTVAFRAPSGPGVVVTATPGPDGISVVAHDETAPPSRPVRDDDRDEDEDDD